MKFERKRHRCFYCGKGWILIRWSEMTDTPWEQSRYVCLHHTIKHLREA